MGSNCRSVLFYRYHLHEPEVLKMLGSACIPASIAFEETCDTACALEKTSRSNFVSTHYCLHEDEVNEAYSQIA